MENKRNQKVKRLASTIKAQNKLHLPLMPRTQKEKVWYFFQLPIIDNPLENDYLSRSGRTRPTMSLALPLYLRGIITKLLRRPKLGPA